MRLYSVAFVLFVCACQSEAERNNIAAEAAAKQQAEVETRAKELAAKMAAELEEKRKAEDAEAAKRRAAEEVERKASDERAARQNLEHAPNDSFEASGVEFFDKGILNSYRQVTKVTLTNKSKYGVGNIRARVDFIKDGDVAASIPLKLTGSLPAGGTRTFSAADSTLSGSTVQTAISQTTFTVTAVTIE